MNFPGDSEVVENGNPIIGLRELEWPWMAILHYIVSWSTWSSRFTLLIDLQTAPWYLCWMQRWYGEGHIKTVELLYITSNWSPTPVAAGYGRLTSTHASYVGRTPGSETGALLSPVHGFGTLPVDWNSASRTLNLLHFGGC